jgi:hypothetical protein
LHLGSPAIQRTNNVNFCSLNYWMNLVLVLKL